MNNYPDLLSILINLGGAIPPLILAMQTMTGLMGVYLTMVGLLELWGSSNEGSSKFLAGSRRFTFAGGISNLFVGACMIGLATLDVVNIFSRTMTGDFVTSQLLSYDSTGNGLSEKAAIATHVIYMIMQVVGFVAFIKAFLTLNRHYNGDTRQNLGHVFGWLIGGFVCWNAQWFIGVLNNTIGFDLIGLFFSF